MTDFASRLTEFVSQPLVPWGILGVIVVGVLLGQVGKHVPEARHRFSKTGWLNALGWFAVLFSPVLLLLFLSVLAMLAQVGWKILTGDTMQGEADNLRWYVLSFVGLLTALGGIIGTPLALIRVWTTERQTKTAEQGHITDRINKAVEGLGTVRNVRRHSKDSHGKPRFEIAPKERPAHGVYPGATIGIPRQQKEPPQLNYDKPIYVEETVPNLEVRIGAIYSLERIAKDSPRDHLQIMEILCAYIRENAPAGPLTPSRPSYTPPRVREDIQSAIRVIGRRTEHQKLIEEKEQFRLDLRNVDLSGADFRHLDFTGADFSYANLEGIPFCNATLIGTNFHNCLLNFSDWRRANATGAIFDRTYVTQDLGFSRLPFIHAQIFGASIAGANLSGINYIPSESLKDLFATADTEFGEGETKELWENARAAVRMFQYVADSPEGPKYQERLTTIRKLNAESLIEWSALKSEDLFNQTLRSKFMQKRNLTGWPYWD